MVLRRVDFYIHDRFIEVAGQDYLLGELSCDLLNISPTDYDGLQRLTQQLGNGQDKAIIHQLHCKLMERKLFRFVMDYNDYGTADQYRKIVSDIYSFNQTMFWFIDKGIMHLKKLDSENFAAALYDFYTHHSIHKMMVLPTGNSPHEFTLFDNIDVCYVPREIPNKPDNYAIYEVYSVNYLQAFLKIDFMKALMAGHTFRRCKNCKKFFLLTQGYKTDYCDRPLADNPKRTCRQQGAKNIAKEKAVNNPVLRTYNTAYRRITADKNRGNITPEQWVQAKRRLADLRDMATCGRLRDAELKQQTESEALYGSLGIDRKNKR